ncbi:hypothetical protein HanXRQr2_Chr08g0326791 [Helianthus annuus]|uniref:Uncharacterized protein n=1 Tax=Helianthus annuus TaxID=4232 RepID=A0A9K3ICQ0_HELAN|nr:hypothetical protein HanXRQr2_Chr08g0326791 [Helianthus annuus]
MIPWDFLFNLLKYTLLLLMFTFFIICRRSWRRWWRGSNMLLRLLFMSARQFFLNFFHKPLFLLWGRSRGWDRYFFTFLNWDTCVGLILFDFFLFLLFFVPFDLFLNLILQRLLFLLLLSIFALLITRLYIIFICKNMLVKFDPN